MTIAALPMYDWPEARADTDAEWADLRARLIAAGINAPETIVRRNAELPAVPGGIRDGDGGLIAPDPATLPPDEFDFQTLWKHPALLFAQTCWGPMEEGLAQHVVVVGQPSYDGIEGGQGELYSSPILMRRGLPSPLRGGSSREADRGGGGAESSATFATPTPALRADPPRKGEGVAAPPDGHALLPLDLFRNKRFAYNSLDSMSGIIALSRDLEAAGASLAIFSERIEISAHRASIVAVAEGRADVCAVDCRSWHLARLHEPRAADVVIVGWTARRKGLPYITSRHTPPEIVARLKAALR
jgi:ABC-type phosphate/phosphonate transport system substrate-binding protein